MDLTEIFKPNQTKPNPEDTSKLPQDGTLLELKEKQETSLGLE